MNGYASLAGRYLRQQRRRSVLTIVGIVLSVALISALGTMGQSMKDNILLQQIYNNGAFHFSYKKETSALYDKLKANALVDRVGAYLQGSQTRLGASYAVRLDEATTDAFALLPVHLQQGRWPEKEGEVVLEQWILPCLPGKPALGGTAKLAAPDGKTREYRIVGILKNEQLTQLNGSARALAWMDRPPADHPSDLYVALKKGVGISRHLAEFRQLAPDKMSTNDQVLALMGESGDSGLNRALGIIFGTLTALVVLSTVAVIYNAFHISVLERIRQFGLLRTLGATPRQIRGIVFREASTLAAIGIPLGLLVGWGALWAVLELMISAGFHILQFEDFRLQLHGWIIGGSVLVGLLAVYAAAWLPAGKASRVSPVEAVRGAGSIVRETYRRSRIPSPLRLAGIEGQMASKNVRRNRSKFRITTFSIVVSVALFIVFHYFTQESLRMTVDTNENDRIAFTLVQNYRNAEGDGAASAQVPDIADAATMARIAKLPGVAGVYGTYNHPEAYALVAPDRLNPDFERIARVRWDSVNWKGQAYRSVNVDLNLYDDARLREAASYLKAGTADPQRMAAEDGVLLVQTVKPYDQAEHKRVYMDLTDYKVGDKLALRFPDPNRPDRLIVREVKVAGILLQSPFGAPYQSDSPTVIAAKPTFAKLIQAAPGESRYGTAMVAVDVALKDGADPEPVRQALEAIAMDIPGGRLIDIAGQQKEERQFNLQMQIFVYGFLAVIGLIGSLNIVNTVQTNLLLRRREFGLLQAVGMTMGQIRRMATAEGLWFGVIGGFWGLAAGIAISYFLSVQINGVQGVGFRFPWVGAAIACGFALAVGILSVQGPLRRLSKANLIETLREEA